MNKEFVSYEQALALKELGFDEPCFGYYDNQIKELDIISIEVCERLCKHETHIKAPTFSQAFRWFREKHGLYTEMFVDDDKTFGFMISYFVTGSRIDKPIVRSYNTYEEAEQACLDKLIEIVKTKNYEKDN